MEYWDAIIIGAGPAGLAAAAELGRAGVRVLLLDEQATPGGQIYRGVENASPALRAALGADYARGAGLVAAMRASGAEYRPGSFVWQITPDRALWVSRGGQSTQMQAAAVLLATGAMERPVPVPGWTLPGVMGAGAVQTLLKSAALAPERLVLAGSGPLLFLLAVQCLNAGAPVAAILDTTSRANEIAAAKLLPGVLAGPGRSYIFKGFMLKAALRAAGVAVHRHVTNLRLEGKDRLQAVHFTSHGRTESIETGLLALHEGVIPAQQITRALGCAHGWDAAQHCFHPSCDDWGQTSVDGVLVAGDAAGIGGALAAEQAGRIAAAEMLRRLGRVDAGQRDRMAAPALAARRAHLAARPFLDQLFAPPAGVLRPADAVTVCRCEEITAGALREMAAQGCQGPNQAKSFLRVGMGPCQGRLCGPVVTDVLAGAHGIAPAESGYFRIRFPLKPIRLGELAEG